MSFRRMEGARGIQAPLATRGILTAFGLNNPKVVRLEPPLKHIDQAVEALGESLAATKVALEGVL